MSEDQKYYGICTTCNNAPFCAYSKNSKRPVWFCEMFQNQTPTESSPPKNSENLNSEKKSKTDKSKYKGLCINCENRDTCTFPKLEGGVWHCSEYR